MKFWVTCTECGNEVKHNFGGGKKAEAAYERMKDHFVCDHCREAAREAAYEAKKQSDIESKLAAGWQWKSVHYADWKNTFQGMTDEDGNEIQKGEYHADTKHIDILVPPAIVAEHFTPELPAEDADFEEQIEWESFPVNECYIEKKTEKSVLIALPSNSDFAGYKFWHPRKCLFDNGLGMMPDLRFNQTWKFQLFANGGALTMEVDADDFVDGLPGTGFARYEKQPELYSPLPISPIENPTAIAELIDND